MSAEAPKDIEILYSMLADAQEHRKKKIGDRWEKAIKYMRGEQTRFPGKNRADDDHWKADTKTNLIWANYLQSLAVLMRDIPRLSMSGREYIHDEIANSIERKINQNWLANAFSERQEEIFFNSYVYGKAWFKLTWDGRMDRGIGNMRIEIPKTPDMYPMPGKDRSTDGQFLIQLYTVDKMTLCQAYPERKDEIIRLFTPRGGSAEFGSGNGTTINPEPGSEGLRTDGTGLTMYYRERGNPTPTSVILAEMWMNDDTTMERYGWVTEVNDKGRKSYKKRKRHFAAYPTGRMIRWAGHMILEDLPNPFPQFPYVEMINVHDGQEWPQGDCDQLIPIQDIYDTQHNQQVDSVNAAIGGDKVFYGERSGLDPTTISNDPAERYIGIPDPTQMKEIRAAQVPPALFELGNTTREDFDRISGYPEASANSNSEIRSGYAFEIVDEAKKGRLKLKTYTFEAAIAELARLQTLYLGMFNEQGVHYPMNENLKGVHPEMFNYTVTAGLNLPASRRSTEQYLFSLFDRAATIQSPLQAVMFHYIVEQSDIPEKDELLAKIEQILSSPQTYQPPNLQVVGGEGAPE